MTPERANYAHKRITRLTAKIEALEANKNPYRASVVRRQLASSKQALKRWQKELRDG